MKSKEMTVSRHILPSGLTILVETLPYVRSVALGFYLRSGSAVESEEHGGASHFLEHLVFKGTATRSTSDIAQVIDILGGDVDAFTGKEYTSFYAHVLDEQVDTAPKASDGLGQTARSVQLTLPHLDGSGSV